MRYTILILVLTYLSLLSNVSSFDIRNYKVNHAGTLSTESELEAQRHRMGVVYVDEAGATYVVDIETSEYYTVSDPLKSKMAERRAENIPPEGVFAGMSEAEIDAEFEKQYAEALANRAAAQSKSRSLAAPADPDLEPRRSGCVPKGCFAWWACRYPCRWCEMVVQYYAGYCVG